MFCGVSSRDYDGDFRLYCVRDESDGSPSARLTVYYCPFQVHENCFVPSFLMGMK